MSIPNSDDISGMDWALDGRPFVNLSSASNINTYLLDWALDASPFTSALLSEQNVCTIEFEELINVTDYAPSFEVTNTYTELTEVTDSGIVTDGNANAADSSSVTDEFSIEIILNFEELIGPTDSAEINYSFEYDFSYSCKLKILATYDENFTNKLTVYANSDANYTTNIHVLEDDSVGITSITSAENPLEPTVVVNGAFVVENGSTSGGVTDLANTCLYVSLLNGGLSNCNLCDLTALSFTLDYNGGEWSETSPCELGICNQQIDIYGFKGTIKNIGFEISSSSLGRNYSGTFGAPGLAKEFHYILSGNSQFTDLLTDQTLSYAPSDKWATAHAAASAIASRSGVSLQWAVHDVPLKDFRLEEGQTALEALNTLAARVGAQLRWNGNNKYAIVYPNFYRGLWEVPSCDLLLPGAQVKDCNCDLSTYLRNSKIIIASSPTRVDPGVNILPNANADNNGSAPQVQLVAKNTKRLTNQDPDLVYDLPFDYDHVYIQTLVPASGSTGGNNEISVENFVTANPQDYFLFDNNDLAEPFVFTSNIGGVYQPQVKLNYKVLPAEGSNPTIDSGNFVTSLYVTRKSLSQEFEKQQEEEKAREKEELGRTQDSYRFIKTCQYTIQVVMFGSIPVPGMWGKVTIPGVKAYISDCDNSGSYIIEDYGDITLEDIIESVNFNYPGYLTVTMAQYRKLLFYNTAQINYGP